MSSSRLFSDGGRQGKVAGGSNFARTCNLLSQYVKERGSLKDLNLEIGGKVESFEALVKPGSTHAAPASVTMNLLTIMEKSAQASTEQRSAVEYIPRLTPDCSINTTEDAFNKVSTSKGAIPVEHKAAPLTIFYSGRVFVFNDYPTDKAKELFTFTKNISPQMSLGILSNTLQEKPNPNNFVPRAQGISSNFCKETANPSTSVAMASGLKSGEGVPTQPESANGSDLPIARRSSLHRFLEKRKERAAARGPYHVQVQEQSASYSSSKGDEQLELKL